MANDLWEDFFLEDPGEAPDDFGLENYDLTGDQTEQDPRTSEEITEAYDRYNYWS